MVPIVVVDDAKSDLLLASRIFRQARILNPIILLKSGQECLNYFSAEGKFRERQLPCLVFLDMVMAPVSGLDVLRKLQSDPQAAGSILAMISGLSDIRLIQEGYRAGGRTFLLKPLREDDLSTTLRGLRGVHLFQSPAGCEISLTPQMAPVGPESGVKTPAAGAVRSS